MIVALALTIIMTLQLEGESVESDAIEKARRSAVSTIDGDLPATRFEEWFAGLTGAGSRVAWEVHDCGEQTGNPELDRSRDFPMCVEARAELQEASVSVVLWVGTWDSGIGAGPPRFWSAYIQRSGEGLQRIQSLAAVRAALGP